MQSIKDTMYIDNVNFNRNYNVNENYNDNVRSRSANQVDAIADRIMAKLSATDNRAFYCKVGWKMSEAVINNNLEQALKGNNPQRYFTWLCKRAGL